jgi:hypothetical protein
MDGRTKKVLAFLLLALASGCSAPRFDGCTLEGKAAIIDEVHKALNSEDCATAIAQIEGVYASECTSNEIRYARAAAQACAAGMSNTFRFVGQLAENSGSLGGATFWKVMTQLFYSSDTDTLDTRVQAGWNATDALQSMLQLGAVVASANQVNADTFNVGSTIPADRLADANAYLIFVSMAMIGSIQSRYGGPNPSTFGRGQTLGATVANPDGWTKATSVDETACSYASSVVNMLDGINEVTGLLSGTLKNSLESISGAFSAQIADACNAGCRGGMHNGVNYAITGCSFADDICEGTDETPCVSALRDRTSCTGQVSNRATCAAAGIARFVSADPFVGWQP